MGDRLLVSSGGLVRYLWQALSTCLFPSRCAACNRFMSPLFTEARGSTAIGAACQAEAAVNTLAHASGYLCPDCLDGCQPLSSPMCPRCGLMFKSRIGPDHRCSDCLSGDGFYGIARAGGIYQGGVMDLVHQLKYKGRLALARPMGRMLKDVFQYYWRARPVDLIVPIPLHPGRLRRRGFNQTLLLWRAWQQAVAAGPETAPVPDGSAAILTRSRRTLPQTGLNRRDRRGNMRGAFTVIDRERIKERRLLLLDDVFTTGATVEEAARVLLAAGAASVDVMTVARTLR